MKWNNLNKLVVFSVILPTFATVRGGDSETDARVKSLLEKIRSSDDEIRHAARREAPLLGAPAVVPLGRVAAAGERPAAIAARQALEDIVHHAGRPGATVERRRVAQELAKLVAEASDADLRRETLHLIGFIGGDPEVPAIALCLGDPAPHVAEAARMALERIPTPQALAALIEAAKEAGEERKGAFLYSISKKRDSSASGFLVGLTSSASDKVRFAALEALARMGSIDGLRPLAAAVDDPSTPDRHRLYNEYLRLADNLKRPDHAEEARIMYLHALRQAPLGFQRRRALHRLAPGGDIEAVYALLIGLADSSEAVRRLALRRLADLKGPGVVGALRRGYDEAEGDNRAILLRALAERDLAAAKPLIERAAASENVGLKVVARDLQGRLDDPALEETYVRAARGDSDLVRLAALKGYLLLAEKRLGKEERKKALDMYTLALELARDDAQRHEALEGILAIADPRSVEQLEPLLADPLLGIEAAAGYVRLAAAIGAAGDTDNAERRLRRVLTGKFPRDLVERAAEELRRIGRDPQRHVRAQGFVLDWWLTGPIQDPDGKGLGTVYFPERQIRLDQVELIGPRRFRWQKLSSLSVDGRIDLMPRFRRSERVLAYAYTEIEAKAAKDVIFKIGSDDGVACWLNGRRIHYNPAARGLVVDEDKIPARLEGGTNRVLLKVNNLGGDWGFVLRITDPAGKPLDLGH